MQLVTPFVFEHAHSYAQMRGMRAPMSLVNASGLKFQGQFKHAKRHFGGRTLHIMLRSLCALFVVICSYDTRCWHAALYNILQNVCTMNIANMLFHLW